MCFTVDNVKDLQFILEQHMEQVRESPSAFSVGFVMFYCVEFVMISPFVPPQFETGMLGCVLLTISAVLSRSIEK